MDAAAAPPPADDRAFPFARLADAADAAAAAPVDADDDGVDASSPRLPPACVSFLEANGIFTGTTGWGVGVGVDAGTGGR